MPRPEKWAIIYNLVDQQCSSSEYIPDYNDIQEIQNFQLDKNYIYKLRDKKVEQDQIILPRQIILNYPVSQARRRQSKRQLKQAKKQYKQQHLVKIHTDQQHFKLQAESSEKNQHETSQDKSTNFKHESQSEPKSKIMQFILKKSKQANQSRVKSQKKDRAKRQVSGCINSKRSKKKNSIVKLQG